MLQAISHAHFKAFNGLDLFLYNVFYSLTLFSIFENEMKLPLPSVGERATEIQQSILRESPTFNERPTSKIQKPCAEIVIIYKLCRVLGSHRSV